MNIAIRKLALLEKTMQEREEAEKLGYVTKPVDPYLKERVSRLMEKINII